MIEGPGLPDEVSAQTDMEQHMEHITQETVRRWYARVLSVFIVVCSFLLSAPP